MRDRNGKRRTGERLGTWALGAMLLGPACAGDKSEPLGTAQVALTNVPAGVGCVKVTAVGARSVERNFDVVPGQSSVLDLGGLPTGKVQFFGAAFQGGCSQLGAGAVASWVGDPVEAEIVPGAPARVNLPLRQNGRGVLAVDFVTDPVTGAPCVGEQAGCLHPGDAVAPAGQPVPDGAKVVSPQEFGRLLAAGELKLVGARTEGASSEQIRQDTDKARALVKERLANQPERLKRLLEPLPESDKLRRLHDGNYELTLDEGDAAGNKQKVVTMGGDFAAGQTGFALARFLEQDNQFGAYLNFYDELPPEYKVRNQLPKPEELRQLPAESILSLNRKIAADVDGILDIIGNLDLPPAGYPGSCDKEEGTPANPRDQTGGSCSPSPTSIFGGSKFPLKWRTTCVKNQAGRGTCAAFGLTGAIETSIAAKYNRWMNLSEQRAYFWAKVPERCSDGLWPGPALKNMATAGFVFPFETNWDYNTTNGTHTGGYPACFANTCVGYTGEHCSGTVHQGDMICASILGFTFCATDGSAPGTSGRGVIGAHELYDFGTGTGTALGILALALKTPLVMSYEVPPSYTGAAANGVVTYVGGAETSYGLHASTVVGYVSNSKLPAGIPAGAGGGYFVVKNSWGKCWKDGGFVYLPHQWVLDYAVSLVSTRTN